MDFLGLALADGHGETAAHHVAEYVVEYIVDAERFFVGAELFEQVDGGDDPATGAADAGARQHPRPTRRRR